MSSLPPLPTIFISFLIENIFIQYILVRITSHSTPPSFYPFFPAIQTIFCLLLIGKNRFLRDNKIKYNKTKQKLSYWSWTRQTNTMKKAIKKAEESGNGVFPCSGVA